MADRSEDSLMEKIAQKIHEHNSSSSDSDDEKPKSSDPSIKSKIYRLFGREKPVHQVLGGGKLLALLHVVPIVYEKYEDKIDSFGEKAVREFKKQYAVFDAKVLSKIPKGPLKDKKN
ncbi:hypothetical protein HPP92_002513 [Vanilla planifolia]|uniref:Reticulon domain-containing protein n=1 Tax=Vanilla planifolia TaxID=51239 RepID=A0A835S9X0_VANPL|nr:hypothetical protein HPP92_002513 [Vanilla planifolia]